MAEADALSFELHDKRAPVTAGARLSAARERAGLDRAQLSLRTKINERHLQALEAGDFGALPARIYAVGFSRAYAAAVGLDPAEIVAEVRRELATQDAPPPPPAHQLDIEDPAKIPSRALAWAAAIAVLGLLALGAVFWRTTFVPAVELPPVREEVVATAPAAPDLSPAAVVDPTAESAAAMAAPAAAEPLAPAPRSVPPRAEAGSAATQSLPSPVPERLEPAPQPATPPAAGAEPAAPAGDGAPAGGDNARSQR